VQALLAILCAAVLGVGAGGSGSSSPALLASSSALTGPRKVWSFPHTSGFSLVVLGDRGTTALILNGSSTPRLAMLSSYDADPPLPVWTIPAPPVGVVAIRSADETDIFVQSDFTQTGPFSNFSSLRKYTSGSATPDWSYDFLLQGPLLFPTHDVSRDGQTIVGLIEDQGAQVHDFVVLGPDSGIPLAEFSLPSPDWGNDELALCADGSIAAFVTPKVGSSYPARTHVVELATRSLLGSILGKMPFMGGGISADGSLVVVLRWDASSANHVVLHARSPSGYGPVLDIATAPELEPIDAALSEDGSVLAAAWWDSTNDWSRVDVRAFDVATGVQTMRCLLGGAGALKNRPSDVAISADGSRFAVGSWGDGSTTSPELAIFSPDHDLPLVEFPAGGSVYRVDLSADGQRLAASRLPEGKHANVGYNDTLTELYDLGGQDLIVDGKPSLGATVKLQLHAKPGATAVLLTSTALAPQPVHIPGVGRLALDRSRLAASSLGVVPASGVLDTTLTLPALPSLLGTKVFLQALSGSPKALSMSWVPITFLP
jgi:hypothetical protein